MRVGVLISGRGSDLGVLIADAARPGCPYALACVISNRADAAGLGLAANAGLPGIVIPHRNYPDRAAFEDALQAELKRHGVEAVVLAGFLRVLTAGFIARWPGRMLNIHPSLLPAFPGLDTHARALAAGVKLHGCTVHFVAPAVDAGPIVAQAAVAVLDDDTPGTLAERVLREEHRILPAAVRALAMGALRVVDARVFCGTGAHGHHRPELTPAATLR